MTTAECFELSITRQIDASPATVWRVWTERLEEWWAPKPWTTWVIENDFRPGGRSAMVMSGPDGASSPMEGVFLEITPQRRIVFTNVFRAGWIPQPPFMVGIFEFAEDGNRTQYTAKARHWDEPAMRQHEAMGFQAGWTTVAGQLAAIAEGEA